MSSNVEKIVEINKKLKSLSSQKCKLKKVRQLPSVTEKITEILVETEQLREQKRLLMEPKKTFTTLEQKDVDLLDYSETLRAIESIRSKKSNTKHYEDQTEFKNAETIEKMLLERRSAIEPTKKTGISFSVINELLEQDLIQNDPKWLHNKLKELITNN